MVLQVNITARAEADIDAALAWIQATAPAAVAGWYARLMATVQTLEQFPHRCSQAAEADDLGIDLRELLFGKRRGVFRILFTIDGSVVNVMFVRRASRGPVTADDL